MITINQL